MRTLIVACLILIASYSFSQKRNNIWMLGGYGPNNMGLDFTAGNVDTFSVYRPMEFFITNASICDTSGQLLFYTNGDYIENRNHTRLLNSTNFNPTLTGDTVFGLNGEQAAIVLPYPDHPDWYYLLHVNGESFTAHSQGEFQPFALWYSIIDMNLDLGMGGIIADKKTIPVITDTLTWGRITACKHANGRDWWVIMHRYYSDLYYKLLVTPDTIIKYSQDIGSLITRDVLGQAVFSQDGTKFAMLSYNQNLDIMDFDRCDGNFSNPISLIVHDGTLATLGCAFSPSGQFLYVCTNEHVFQFDMYATNIDASKVTVATYDGYVSSLHSTFFMMQLAPNQKIYISTYEGTDVMHVIDDPDQLGLACSLVQHQLRLPSFNAQALPNAPNYNLGPMIGSICDSLVTGAQSLSVQNSKVDVFPNPSLGIFSVKMNDVTDKIVSVIIEDMLGKAVSTVVNSNSTLDITSEPAGVYFLKLETKKWKKVVVKLIKE